MKACFLLQRRFAHVGHQMAVLLKERHGIEEFCGYVTMRSSLDFLKSQKEINYTQLLLEEDIYARYKNEKIDYDFLRIFKKEYGVPNLWPYINLDRVLMYNQLVRAYPADSSKYSHEDLIKIFQVTAKAVINFLEEEKPDFIFFQIVGNLGSYLLYEVAKKKGISTYFVYEPRTGNTQTISKSYAKHSYIDNTIKYIKENKNDPKVEEKVREAKEFLEEFQDKPFYYLRNSEAISKYTQNVASRIYHFKFLKLKNIWISIHWFFKSYFDYFLNKNNDKNDYSTIKPWWEAWDKLVRKLRILRGYKDLYDDVDLKEDYAYFALHFEPESLFPFTAPFYTDQQWVIAQTAKSLPLHYKLYVKDHPQMYGNRPRSYYKKLKKIPNVKLIKPSYSSLELIQDSKIVTTITGTAAWEAALLKKPVIVFGEVFYSQLSTIKVCNNITKLPFIINDQLENFTYNENELVDFLSGLFMESVELDLTQIWDEEGASKVEKKKKALVDLVDLLASKIKLDQKEGVDKN